MDDNGILRTVPGDCIGGASLTLPAPETATVDSMSAVVDAGGHVGWVRIYYERRLIRHRKHSHWAWLVRRAEAISAPE